MIEKFPDQLTDRAATQWEMAKKINELISHIEDLEDRVEWLSKKFDWHTTNDERHN